MNQIISKEFSTDIKEVRVIYLFGAIFTILVLAGIVLDIIVGNLTGGDIATLPATASERFAQFKGNRWLGLYNLDLLNTINQILLIPVYFALYVSHRDRLKLSALFAFLLFLAGTTIFVAGNSALSMLKLSHEYFASADESRKMLIAAAGEAMLAKGAHGSPGVFFSFLLPNIAGVVMSVVMLIGKVFSKMTAWMGITGSALLVIYIILVTFIPAAGESAMILAMPGGLLTMVWMVLIIIRLFRMMKPA